MSQVATPTEPGWKPDPSGRYEWRYWDGGWTNRVANSVPTEVSAATAAAEPAPAPEAPAPAPAVESTTTAPAVEDAAAEPVARSARDTVARAPFGEETTAPAPAPAAPPRRQRRTPWAVVVGFFRSFADQPESYHSELARDPIPADPRGEQIINAPGNYGHAAITALRRGRHRRRCLPALALGRDRTSRTSRGAGSTRAWASATASVPRRSR